MKLLKINIVRCLLCNEVLTSKHQHDFVRCSCENKTSTDGGAFYQKISGVDLNKIKDESIYKEISNVYFTSQSDFKQNINNSEYLKNIEYPACISIVTSEEEKFKLSEQWPASLQLVFADTDDKSDPNCFSEKQAIQILDFLEKEKYRIGNLFIHCLMGISRSAAIALFVKEIIFNKQVPDLARSAYANYNRHIYSTLLKVHSLRLVE